MTEQPTKQEVLDAITKGVHDAVAAVLPTRAEIRDDIEEGTRQAFTVFDSQILDAIADGTKEALKPDGR